LAIKERCVPPPLWSHVVIPHASGSALAINIDPYGGGIVAVRVGADKTKGWGGDAYVFTMRVGTHTQHLTAGQIPMFMDAKVRRTIMLLSKIKVGEPVWVRSLRAALPMAEISTQFSRLEEDLNRVLLEGEDGQTVVPLDAIRTVFAERGGWVLVPGY
jgi:hypothetical protein